MTDTPLQRRHGRRLLRRRYGRRLLRTLLAACLLGLAALGGGCSSGGDDTQVVVLGPWTGPEGEAFEKVLRDLSPGSGHRYVYKGTRSLRETLVAQLAADAPPDVAILNSIGELTEYAARDKLKPLDPSTAERAYAPWSPTLMVDGRRRTYWVPLKVDLKSLMWSRTNSSGAKPRWCVGMAAQATSGWPGTDWVEDILLHQAGPTTYTQWATGQLDWAKSPAVRRAFKTWAGLLETGGSRSPTAVERSLTMSFWGTTDPRNPDGDPRGLLGGSLPGCTHEHQASFVRFVYAPRSDIRVEPAARFLKGSAAHRNAFEVSGDMAAVLTDNPGAQELVKRLTSEEGREQWSSAARPHLRPFFPDRSDPRPEDNAAAQEIASYLTDDANRLCFDASDVMPPVLRDAFYRAVLKYFGHPTEPTLKKLLTQLETVRAQIASPTTPTTIRPPTDICS
ncbi:extracellular solute-binding protein [Streptomyces kunmingensis]|uniref:Extracellular solute-binding protein n=1 Tax=Streptomyces kunmingensis TaxID=68225 RepID=A0ABU6CQL8_9ACTN|nr:extracellular solute-binding protein [Streptomyces kunmingensis]MEB3967045.1 extracellular solute-binding protein [Streptomyces kunmingensis]